MNTKFAAAIIVILVAIITSSIILLSWLGANTESAAQEETLQITESGLWYGNAFPYCQGAVTIVNNKNVAATIQKIAVRGIESNWNDVYYWKGEIGSVSNLGPASNDLTGTSVEILVDGKARTFQQATGNIVLDGYKAIAIYIKNAGSISSQDIPDGEVTIAIFTERNVYLEDVPINVDLSTGFMATEQLTITNVQFGSSWVSLTVNNTATTSIVLNDFFVNNVQQTTFNTGQGIPKSINANTGYVINATVTTPALVSGNNYALKVISAKGNPFSYTATMP